MEFELSKRFIFRYPSVHAHVVHFMGSNFGIVAQFADFCRNKNTRSLEKSILGRLRASTKNLYEALQAWTVRLKDDTNSWKVIANI